MRLRGQLRRGQRYTEADASAGLKAWAHRRLAWPRRGSGARRRRGAGRHLHHHDHGLLQPRRLASISLRCLAHLHQQRRVCLRPGTQHARRRLHGRARRWRSDGGRCEEQLGGGQWEGGRTTLLQRRLPQGLLRLPLARRPDLSHRLLPVVAGVFHRLSVLLLLALGDRVGHWCGAQLLSRVGIVARGIITMAGVDQSFAKLRLREVGEALQLVRRVREVTVVSLGAFTEDKKPAHFRLGKCGCTRGLLLMHMGHRPDADGGVGCARRASGASHPAGGKDALSQRDRDMAVRPGSSRHKLRNVGY
mmetsp:Transcript_115474/g.331448  ORF Transcript_115474/g.331448 Transcript_115474/m.331448 type:complete len:305 (-) Transcript_115474:20-934(-)